MAEMTYTERLIVTHCWCGIALAIPASLHRIANDEGKSVYCPLGHKFVYADSYEKKLQREVERNARLLAERDQIEASLKAQKAATTRFKNKLARAEAGVCPHCNRSFVNLGRHMASRHPDHAPEHPLTA
jgi:hypothetical protein